MGDPTNPKSAKPDGSSAQSGTPKSGADDDFSDVRRRLDALDAKLDAHRDDPVEENRARQERSQWSMAIRVSSDFIAAIFVGGALGWGLDELAGTGPFGLIVLLLLGFAAGVLNVMRTLGLVAQAPSARARDSSSPLGRGETRRHDTGNSDREDR